MRRASQGGGGALVSPDVRLTETCAMQPPGIPVRPRACSPVVGCCACRSTAVTRPSKCTGGGLAMPPFGACFVSSMRSCCRRSRDLRQALVFHSWLTRR